MSVLNNFNKSYLSSFVFVKRAYEELEKISPKDFFLRTGDYRKLIQEIIPIATFLKYFEKPGLKLRCKYVDKAYEAELKIEGRDIRDGFLKKKYFIEVTGADANHYLEREALAYDGFVFGGGNIKKNKLTKNITSKAVAKDMESVAIEAADKVVERLIDKGNKIYPKPCILLVQVDASRPLHLSEWIIVINRVQSSINRNTFELTFLLDAWQNRVFQV